MNIIQNYEMVNCYSNKYNLNKRNYAKFNATQSVKNSEYNIGYYKDYNVNFKNTTISPKIMADSQAAIQRMAEIKDLILKNPKIMEALAERSADSDAAIAIFNGGFEMIKKSPGTVLKLLTIKRRDKNQLSHESYYHNNICLIENPNDNLYYLGAVRNILEYYGDKDEVLEYVLNNKAIINEEIIVRIFEPLSKEPEYAKRIFDKERPDGNMWVPGPFSNYKLLARLLERDPEKAAYLIEQEDMDGNPRFVNLCDVELLIRVYSDDFETLKQRLQEKKVTPEGVKYVHDRKSLLALAGRNEYDFPNC